MNLDGSGVRRLTDFGAMSWAPFFHPSGRYLIFTSNKLGFSNFELYLVDALGERDPVRVTYTDGFDGLPVFSPDGRRLCWTSNRPSDGKSQLFLADWNDATARSALERAPARGNSTTNQALSALSRPRSADSNPEASQEALRVRVNFLASDALAGRMTGSTGALEAARYLADQLT